MMRTFLIALISVLLVFIPTSSPAPAAAQVPNVVDYEMRLAAIPATGIAGFTIQGVLPQGQFPPIPGDFNGNGDADFADVVALFQAVVGGVPVASGSPSGVGTVGRIVGMTIPNYGLEQHAFDDTTFSISIADGNDLIQPGATDVLLFTLQVEEVAKGSTLLYGYTVAVDDDNGDALPRFSVEAQVSF